MNVSDNVSIDDLATISDEAVRHFIANETDRVVVIYQNFKSTFEQKPTRTTMLPLNVETLTQLSLIHISEPTRPY